MLRVRNSTVISKLEILGRNRTKSQEDLDDFPKICLPASNESETEKTGAENGEFVTITRPFRNWVDFQPPEFSFVRACAGP